jgi:hypothetical protein
MQAPRQTATVQVLRRSPCEECAIVDEGRLFIFDQRLHSRLWLASAPTAIDIRPTPTFDADNDHAMLEHFVGGLATP